MATIVRPYPFDSVPRLKQADLASVSLLRRHLGPRAPTALAGWTREYLAIESHDLVLRLRSTTDNLPSGMDRDSARSCRYTLVGPAGHLAELVLDGPLVTAIASAALRAPPTLGARGTRPTPAEQGLVTFGLAWLLARLGTTASWRLQPSADPTLCPPGDAQSVTFEWEVRVATTSSVAWLVVPRPALQQLAGDPPRLTDLPLGRLEGLSLDLPCELASCLLPAHALANLQPGDVMALGQPAGLQAGPVLKLGRGSYSVHADAGQLTITSPYSRSDQIMTQSNKAAPDVSPEAITLAEDIDVQVSVELGRVSVSAMEILRLGKGDVLTLGSPCGGLVDVRAGGRLMGRGEVVDVDGEAGVRLVEVFD